MSTTDRRTELLLALVWPAVFDPCPLANALWCSALERAEFHPDDLEAAMLLVAEARVLYGDRRDPS